MAGHRSGRPYREGGLRLHGGRAIAGFVTGPALDAITGWLLYAAILGVTGAVTLRWVIIPRAVASAALPGPRLRRAAARFGTWCGILLAPALALFFFRQLLEFRDPFVPWQEDALLLLTGTAWGRTFLFGAALSFLVPLAFGLARTGREAAWPVATAGVLALAAFPALTGHASAGEGLLRASTLAADIVHVLAAGAWMGGLAAVLFVDRDAVRGGADPLEALVRAFSPVAIVSVTVLVATGLFASWVHLPAISALWSEPYGQRLAWKLALVAMVLFLGWLNWRRQTPRLAEPGGSAALRRSAMLELAVAQIVLIITAILVRTPPPG
ncbi:MAG: CopD family protein [Gemmatimonadota bacterium]